MQISQRRVTAEVEHTRTDGKATVMVQNAILILVKSEDKRQPVFISLASEETMEAYRQSLCYVKSSKIKKG